MRPLSRREFLRFVLGGALLLSCPGAQAQGGFFTPHERATLEAALARLIPTDQDPGAREANVIQYIENLLSAFEHDPPLIYAGGPFSDRNPFPHPKTGTPSDKFPENSFKRFIRLSRIRELGWRVRLFGSENVPAGGFNDRVLGPVKGLGELYKEGVQMLDEKSRELFDRDFVSLPPQEQDSVLSAVSQRFVAQLYQSAIEGMYGPPEYGGNKELVGWKYIRFLGDTQPLGYSIFDESTGMYKERPGHPVSGPDPDAQKLTLSSELEKLLKELGFVEASEPLSGRSLEGLEAKFRLNITGLYPWGWEDGSAI